MQMIGPLAEILVNQSISSFVSFGEMVMLASSMLRMSVALLNVLEIGILLLATIS